jgi:ABC-type multidrug transport system fused ATPase/permease subunit
VFKTLNKLYLVLNFQKIQLVLVFFLILFSVFLESISIAILVPLVMFIATPESMSDYFATNYFLTSGHSHTKIILIIFILFFLLFIIKFLYLAWLARYKSFFIYSSEYLISKNVLKYFLKNDYNVLSKINSAQVINLVVNQCSILSDYALKSILSIISDLFLILGITLVMFYFQPAMSITIIFFGSATLYFLIFFFKKKSRELSKNKIFFEQKRLQTLNETFGLIKNIKLGLFDIFYLEKYNKFSKESTSQTQKQFFFTSMPILFSELMGVSLLIFYIIYTYYFETLNSSIFPTLALIVASAIRIIPALGRLQASIINLKFANPAIDEMYKIISKDFLETEMPKEKTLVKPFIFKNNLTIKNLNFFYDKNSPIFENANMSFKFGEIVGIHGESGTGKSSLAHLICGLTKPNKGQILVDDISIYQNLNGWQKNIGYVSQDIFLKDASIKNNIAFATQEDFIDEREIERIIALVKLEKFVNNQKLKFSAEVGEKGSAISGGQIQRIGIARALYYKPSFLILDESTNALDYQTENEIFVELKKLRSVLTIFIISHNLKTLKFCDNIFVIKDKKIKKYNEI